LLGSTLKQKITNCWQICKVTSVLGEDDSELRRIDEEPSQSETQPTDSLTGLEEALEELRRYEDGTEDGSNIDFRNMQVQENNASSSASSNAPSTMVTDPLTTYLNPVTSISTIISNNNSTLHTAGAVQFSLSTTGAHF
jgi:hypothetical protein